MLAAGAPLSAHCKKVLETLQKNARPMTAYRLLDKLRKSGIKAPPTVYRALDTLVERGLVHRIESLGAFVACHGKDEEDTHADHSAQFAVCRACGEVAELHDAALAASIQAIARNLHFRVERETLELTGLCRACDAGKTGGEN